MAEQNVTLAPGESRLVSFEATPQEARIYQVAVNGLAGSFRAIQAIIPWAFSSVQCWHSASGVGAWRQSNFACTVTNIGDRTVTKTLTLWKREYRPAEWDYYTGWTWAWFDWETVESVTMTLASGESSQYNQQTQTLMSYDIKREQYLKDSDGYESAHCTIQKIPY